MPDAGADSFVEDIVEAAGGAGVECSEDHAERSGVCFVFTCKLAFSPEFVITVIGLGVSSEEVTDVGDEEATEAAEVAAFFAACAACSNLSTLSFSAA